MPAPTRKLEVSTVPITAVAEETSCGERARAGISAARAGPLAVEIVLNRAASANTTAVGECSSTASEIPASTSARRRFVTSRTRWRE
jgi:hypothetical protein